MPDIRLTVSSNAEQFQRRCNEHPDEPYMLLDDDGKRAWEGTIVIDSADADGTLHCRLVNPQAVAVC